MLNEFLLPNSAALRVLDERGFRQILRRATAALIVALGLPLLVLLGLVLFHLNSARWVNHTDQVISRAVEIEKQLVTMQTSFRGFRLSKDEKFLEPYRIARAEVGPQWENLTALVSDNAGQSADLVQARTAASVWDEFVEGELASLRAGQTQAGDPAFMRKGAPLFNDIINRLDAFVKREKSQRTVRVERLNLVTRSLLFTLALSAVLGIPAVTMGVHRLLKKVSDSYRTSTTEANRRARELYVTLSSIGDAVVATNAEGAVTFLNPVAEKLMGWTSAEAQGRPLAEVFNIYNEQSGAAAENPVSRVLRDNIIVGLANHTVLRSREGRELPIEDSAAPIRDEQGNVIGVILVFHDVSENRAAARQLQASEQRFRFLNDLGESTRALIDPEQIMEVSTRMLGEHLRASRCAYADVESDGERFTIRKDYTDGCATTEGSYLLSLFGPRATDDMHNGRTLVVRDLDAEMTPEEGATTFDAITIKAIITWPLIKEGRLRAMMAVHQTNPRNWTSEEIELVGEVVERCWATIERARAELALFVAKQEAEAAALAVADSAERFRLLAEVVSLQVWTANPDGALNFANHECEAYFGADPAGILGNAWAQYVHKDDLAAALRCWQISLASGARYEVEFRLRRNDGAFRWFLVRAEAMRDSEGHPVKWIGSNTDIHDLKTAQTAAEGASQAKDAFLAALSHELRTPLTPVLMAATSLRKDERLPREVRDQLGMMERNIGLEARLIDDLLDLTSIVRGKLQLRSEPCDAHSLIGLAMEIVRAEAEAKEISLERNFDAQRSGIVADPARFQQVIWNLLRNAVKFTTRGGRVSIRTSEGDATLHIEIRDSGIGIAPEALDKIFLPFEQADPAGGHRFGGMGLGLAIARAIVDLHGGKITASSPGSGQGSTFSVELPGVIDLPHGVRSSAEAAEPNSASSEGDKADKKGRRLLLVEDHEDSIQMLSQLLTLSGHEVAMARTVTEALAVAAAQTFDLVISDLGLPDGSGNELMEKLRDLYGLRGIALSGYGMEDDVARSLKAGFVAHIIKPVDFTQLARAIAHSA